jgi:hypothetical protein
MLFGQLSEDRLIYSLGLTLGQDDRLLRECVEIGAFGEPALQALTFALGQSCVEYDRGALPLIQIDTDRVRHRGQCPREAGSGSSRLLFSLQNPPKWRGQTVLLAETSEPRCLTRPVSAITTRDEIRGQAAVPS